MNTQLFSPVVNTVVPEESTFTRVIKFDRRTYYEFDKDGNYIRNHYIRKEIGKIIIDILLNYNNIYFTVYTESYFENEYVEVLIKIKYARYSTVPTVLEILDNNADLQKLYEEIIDENEYFRNKSDFLEKSNKLYYKEINELRTKLNTTWWERIINWWKDK